MDISDGLALDLSRLAAESGCGAVIYTDQVPISDAAAQIGKQANRPLKSRRPLYVTLWATAKTSSFCSLPRRPWPMQCSAINRSLAVSLASAS